MSLKAVCLICFPVWFLGSNVVTKNVVLLTDDRNLRVRGRSQDDDPVPTISLRDFLIWARDPTKAGKWIKWWCRRRWIPQRPSLDWTLSQPSMQARELLRSVRVRAGVGLSSGLCGPTCARVGQLVKLKKGCCASGWPKPACSFLWQRTSWPQRAVGRNFWTFHDYGRSTDRSLASHENSIWWHDAVYWESNTDPHAIRSQNLEHICTGAALDFSLLVPYFLNEQCKVSGRASRFNFLQLSLPSLSSS